MGAALSRNEVSLLPPYEMAQIDGLAIHVRRSPRPGAPKVVLTGGFPQSIHCWEPCWSALAAQADLLALDLPGFGRSEGRAELMRPSAAGAFFVRALRHFAFEGAHAAMPDVGVPVALWTLSHAPDALSSATLANGPGVHPPTLGGGLGLGTSTHLARRLLSATPETFVAVALARGYAAFEPPKALRATYVDCYRRGRLLGALAFIGSYPRELPAITNRLGEIEQPVHIVWGRRDPFLAESNAHRLLSALRRGSLELLDDAGHFSHEDAASAFVTHLSSGIRRSTHEGRTEA